MTTHLTHQWKITSGPARAVQAQAHAMQVRDGGHAAHRFAQPILDRNSPVYPAENLSVATAVTGVMLLMLFPAHATRFSTDLTALLEQRRSRTPHDVLTRRPVSSALPSLALLTTGCSRGVEDVVGYGLPIGFGIIGVAALIGSWSESRQFERDEKVSWRFRE